MGAKQSGPAAANGRTRAYSGSDLPSGSSGGANGTAGGGARAAAAGRFPAQVPGAHQPSASGGAAAASAAPRSRSLGGAVGTVAAGARAAQSTFSIPNSSSGPYGSQDSVHSSPEDGGGGGGRDRPAGGGPGGPRLVIGSLPAHLSPHMFGGFKCPVCSKFVPSDEMDLHLVMCLTKPRITYNEDVLSKDAGECAICLEELQQGDTIARLPCLCIYHKGYFLRKLLLGMLLVVILIQEQLELKWAVYNCLELKRIFYVLDILIRFDALNTQCDYSESLLFTSLENKVFTKAENHRKSLHFSAQKLTCG
ncbi:hypothetical protein EI555_009101 [Monodon monoceros]|uniref:RING-type E3 ubiquitin transferase n=1 Tax=Monodon monoceros TaxID=40151 RepID=A0A4U1FUH9_MONMO|nr:hypothetical protein EI555_009101 [Monodon monoceros]